MDLRVRYSTIFNGHSLGRIESSCNRVSRHLRLSMMARVSLLAFVVPSLPVLADDAADSAETTQVERSENTYYGLDEIIVTANKRDQSINEVPLTITAVTGDALITRGITSTADLAKLVPGLTAQPSPFNTPVYTLRGVGFYESTLSASPTVAVYTDEVPLPFSAMTKAAALDLERVEVLKGPQGTLFGNNTTGGAINYIAAKPTDDLSAGVDASVGRFNAVDLQGFVSGPLGGGVRARVAGRIVNSGDWQYSATHNNKLGAQDMIQGRILLDWESGPLKLALNLNGWRDKSDTQAPQRIATYISVPGAPPEQENRDYPYPPFTARAADWSINIPPLERDDYFFQTALRADYQVSDDVIMTSISAFERYKTHSVNDFDGTARNIADPVLDGYINTFSQELRFSGTTDRLNWLVGGNYEYDKTYDNLFYYFQHSTSTYVGTQSMTTVSNFSRQNVKTAAVFGNIEYEIIPRLTLQAGARYTDSRRSFTGCTRDEPGGGAAAVFELIQTFNPALPLVDIPEGSCITFYSDPARFIRPYLVPLQDNLNENNISWRVGANYKTGNGGLIYATVSKGYKAGSFPTTSASFDTQYLPVKQESLVAYEAGFKQPVAGRSLQFNGAFFYYDYRDKQLRGRILDVVFGPLDALVQIPKSRVWGLEGELSARPLDGLSLNVAATYLNSKIQQFVGFNSAGVLEDYAGQRFPYAPKWQVVADAQYDFPITSTLDAFAGASFTYNSATSASLGNIEHLRIKEYGLLDLRAGIKGPDDQWRIQLWGRNVTNSYYWTNALQTQDVYVRFTGRPATYGIMFSARF